MGKANEVHCAHVFMTAILARINKDSLSMMVAKDLR